MLTLLLSKAPGSEIPYCYILRENNCGLLCNFMRSDPDPVCCRVEKKYYIGKRIVQFYLQIFTCIQNFYVYSLHIKVPLFAGLPGGNLDACGSPAHWSGLELSKYFTHEDNSCFLSLPRTVCPRRLVHFS